MCQHLVFKVSVSVLFKHQTIFKVLVSVLYHFISMSIQPYFIPHHHTTHSGNRFYMLL